jgi:hypothetical protein
MSFQKIRISILGLWFGAMALFSFVVAPAAFSALQEPRLAGNVVSRVLGGVEIIGVILGLALIALLLISREYRGKAYLFELLVLALMTAAMIVSRFVVSSRLHELRVKYGDQLSTLAASNPVRSNFDQLHQYSVWLMSFNLLAALALIILLARYSPVSRNHA